jgi:predicted DNA-binding transcriptional regulator AlpA
MGLEKAANAGASLDPQSLLGDAIFGAIRQAVREEIQAVLGNGHGDEDRLLDAEEAAEVLSVSPDWLYRRAKKLPFTRKLGTKMLRFSSQGIQKYLATKKIG